MNKEIEKVLRLFRKQIPNLPNPRLRIIAIKCLELVGHESRFTFIENIEYAIVKAKMYLKYMGQDAPDPRLKPLAQLVTELETALKTFIRDFEIAERKHFKQ